MAGMRPLLPLVTSRSANQGWGSSGQAFSPKLPTLSRPDPQMTALQQLETMWLQRKKRKRGFLGNVLHGSFKGISEALQFIARPSYGIAEGTRRALHGDQNGFDFEKFLSGLGAGLKGNAHTGFGQVLDEHGVLDKHKFLRGAAGFGLDVATDPTMLLSIAAAPVTGGTSLALLGERLAARGLSVKAVQEAAHIAEHGSNDLGALIGARNALHTAGDGFQARAALADARYDQFVIRRADEQRIANGVEPRWTPARQSEMDGLEAFAKAEARNDLPRVLSFQYKIPFSTKTTEKYFKNGRVVLRTPVKTVGVKTLADLKIPVVSKTAEAIGKAFKPGWRNDKFHALERVGRATAEIRETEYISSIGHILKPYIDPKSEKHLSQAEQLDALDFGETAKGIVRIITDKKGNVRSRVLNRKGIQAAVDAGRLTPQQAEFLHAWHKATEVLSDADMDYGRHLPPVLKSALKDKNDVIYVPHVYTKDGRKLTQQLGSSILTKPGYEYARLANKPNSVKELQALHASGVYNDLVETDPATLLAMRARRGAQAHADAMVEKVIATAEGIPTKIPNAVAQAKHAKAITEREAALRKLPLATRDGFRKEAQRQYDEISAKVDVRRNEALAKFDARTNGLRKEIKALQDSIRKRKPVPTGAQVMGMSSKVFNEIFKDAKLAPMRRLGLRLRSIHSAATSTRRAADALRPTTGNYTKAHGSNYKRLLGQLLDEAKLKSPRVEGKTDKASVYLGKQYRAYARDLKTLQENLLLSPMKKGESWQTRLETAIRVLDKRAKDDWNDMLKEIGYKAPPPGRASALTAKKKALARHLAKRDELNARFDQRRDAAAVKALNKLQAKAGRQIKAAETQRKLIAKHERAITHHETSMDNPLAKRTGYIKNDKIKAENGKPMAIPVEIDEAIRRIRQNIHDDQFLADFQRTWSRLIGKWKVGVTVVNPGYRIRNTVSDMWNMFISPEGGVPLWAMGKYGSEAADIIYKRIPAGDREALNLFQEAYEHSVMSGLFGGDIERVLRTMRSGLKDERGRDYAKQGRMIKAWTTGATTFNRNAENWGRLTHYLYRRQYQKMSPAEAARIVRIAHFDYEDLTPFERKIKGNLVPFYTWTRNNIPYQLTQMIAAPGRYSAFTKLANEMEYASGEGGVEPDWIKQSFGFRVPFGGKNNYFLPQFGPADLSKLQSPGQFASLLGPLVKTPIELATNKSLMTGAPIYGSELTHPRNPVSGAAAPLLSLIPGANVGQTMRPVDGKDVTGPGANPLISYIAGQTPMTNIFVNQMSNIRRAQRGRNASLLSYFGGVSTYAPSEDQTIGIAEQDMAQAFRQYVRGLRDEGQWPNTKAEKPSAYEKRKRKLLLEILQNQ